MSILTSAGAESSDERGSPGVTAVPTAPASRPAVSVREYNAEYYRRVRRRRSGSAIGRVELELDKALECLVDEFNAASTSGTSGLRAQAIAHVRQALLILSAPRRRTHTHA